MLVHVRASSCSAAATDLIIVTLCVQQPQPAGDERMLDVGGMI